MTTMETLKNEDTSKLSRTELRKQKLAEYLAAKGRFKLPNPKPYLKDSAVLKKPTGATQSFQGLCKGKENQTSSAASVRKDINLKNALTEKNKNTTTSKKELRSISTAPSATLQHATFKSALSQTVQHNRTLSKGTAAIRGMYVKGQQTKPPINTVIGTQKQVKTDRVLKSEQVKTSCGISRLVEQTAKQDIGRKQYVVKKESSVKMISRSQIKCPTATEHLPNSRNKAKTMTNTQTKLPQAKHTQTIKKGSGQLCSTYSEAPKVMKSQVNNSQTKNVRSEVIQNKTKNARSETAQNKTLSQLNEPGNKLALTVAQKTATAMAKQRVSKVFKTGDAPKTSVTAAGNKNSLPQKPHNTVRLPANTTVPVSVSQKAPYLSKSCTKAKKDVLPKTPKTVQSPGTQGVRTVPLDGKKKMTAAQEERMRKLQEWRESRGITYKRPPMPVKPVRRKTTAAVSQSYWATMEQEDEVHGFVCAVDQSLDDCIKLVAQGCDLDQVRKVLSRLPMAQKFAKYWICQVKLMEKEGDLNVLPTFEEAVRVVREPVDELRSVVFEILKKKEAKGSCSNKMEEEKEAHGQEEGKRDCDMHTPKPVGALIRCMKGDSSVIKYKITATPGGKMSQQREKSGQVDGHEIRFFTPVRRSVRIEKTAPRYPAALQEHDPCVTTLQDLLTGSEGEAESTCATESSSSPLYVYRENEALKEHVQIELVFEEAETG